MLNNTDFKSFLIGFLLAMVMMLMMGSAPALEGGDTLTIKHFHTNWSGDKGLRLTGQLTGQFDQLLEQFKIVVHDSSVTTTERHYAPLLTTEIEDFVL